MQECLLSAREQREQAEAMAELSRAKVSEFDVPTMSKVDQYGRPQSLKPCQRAGIEYAVKAKRTFIGDQQGIGNQVFLLIRDSLKSLADAGLLRPIDLGEATHTTLQRSPGSGTNTQGPCAV